MKVEDDAALLNTLGVTSAKPEDIERNILEKARSDLYGDDASIKEEVHDGSSDIAPATANKKELYSKLRAVQIEIDAVASAVEQTKNAAKTQKQNFDGIKEEDTEEDKRIYGSLNADSTLHHALAADRLNSLKKTRSQLQKELSNLSKGSPTDVYDNEKVLQALVRDDSKSKGKLKHKEVSDSNKRPQKKSKAYSFDEDGDFDAALNAASGGFIETERDELIRKGILTPFHKLKGFERRIQQPGHSNAPYEKDIDGNASSSAARVAQSLELAAQARPTTKLLDPQDLPKLHPPAQQFQSLRAPFKVPKILNGDEGKTQGTQRKTRRPLPGKRWRKRISHEELELEAGKSVPNDLVTHSTEENGDMEDEDEDEPPFVILEGGLKIPETIFNNLFDYQKVGVQWLWELHCQRAGGIIGDEMGLGKTVQVLSFIGALHFSGLYKPSIVVCPVTLLRQWKREAQKWYPDFHVEILHDSAFESVRKKRTKSDESEGESEHGSGDSSGSDYGKEKSSRKKRKWDSLLKRVLGTNSGLLITTYEQLRILGETLLNIEWGYAILDEGHRIRNPNADITIVCKQLQTVHRIIMSGSPIQNKLTELWSLFDFVFPGKLGVLPVFEAEFAVPISVGGYANASPLQVSTAYRCAVVLRDLILPYLLRRMKTDVNAQLPKKTEHVLFCSLTPEQRSSYRAFLASSEVEQIFDGSRNSLYGIDVMRKICNHPDLLEREYSSTNPDYGNPERSGKMKVVAEVLKMWKEQNHRALLFAQTQQMLDILENFLISNSYSYRRMDGLTPVKHRMALIDEFNNSTEVFIFILTTKVGGLGTNLTGADRVIIFDPDWNPSTDMQARERAWRIGQKRDVTVFRLITRGTIEEKVYHRQIYKHFLTNKILKNPQQRRFFKSRDLKDLFVLDEDGDGRSTATLDLFGQVSAEVNVVGAENAGQRSTNSPRRSTVGANGHIDNDEENDKPMQLSSSEITEGTQNGTEADEETGFLKSLFEAHGIHSAVNHDVIMNAHDDDKIRLEEQASRIAQRAAEALRQSRMLRSQESVAVPTWTGKSGSAGAPSTVRRKFGSTVNTQLLASTARSSTTNSSSGGNGIIGAGASSGKVLSSSELLTRIRGNQAVAMADGLEQQFGLTSAVSTTTSSSRAGTSRSSSRNLSGVSPEILIRQICTFMQQRGGRTNSASIVGHFKDRVPPDNLALFKNLLKEIATLDKGPGGSFWILKPEYQ